MRVVPIRAGESTASGALVDATPSLAFCLLRRAVPRDFASVVYRRAGDVLKQRDSRGREYDPQFMFRHAGLFTRASP